MKTLGQVLGTKNLVSVIQGLGRLDPTSKLLPSELLQATRTVTGNRCTYTKVDANRKTARLAMYGSPSARRNLKGISEIPVTLIHTVEHIVLPMTTLMNLKDYQNEQRQKMGMQEVARQTSDFKRYFDNLRAAAVCSALTRGAVYFDADGNLLSSSTNAVVTVDFGIPAGNKGQLNALGTGDIIDASWASADTDIVAQIESLKQAAVQLSNYPIRYALHGKNILGYLQTNTVLKEYLTRTEEMALQAAKNEIPSGLLGLQWLPMQEAYSELEDGGVFWWDDDMVVFMPEPSPDWYEFIEGTYPVPVSFELANNATSAVDVAHSLREQAGMFSYAEMLTDPPSIKMVAGDTFLPVIKVPKAVFIADVTP